MLRLMRHEESIPCHILRSIASDALALPVQSSAVAASASLKKRLEELVQVCRVLSNEMLRHLWVLMPMILHRSLLRQRWRLLGVVRVLHPCVRPLRRCSWLLATKARSGLTRHRMKRKGHLVLLEMNWRVSAWRIWVSAAAAREGQV